MSSSTEGQLSQFQIDVAGAFFSLVESAGFLLAGGGALIAHGIVARDTEDLDFFTQRGGGDVALAAQALVIAAGARNWSVEVIRSGEEFQRLKLSRPADVLYVDFAVDTPPEGAATVTILGPALARSRSPQDPCALQPS